MNLLSMGVETAERGLVPDAVMRIAIRRLCDQRLRKCENVEAESRLAAAQSALWGAMRSGPIALTPEKANEQHYELPPQFFAEVLGPRRKYSCCWWPPGVQGLEQAEEAALAATCERAKLADGQEILELGCGWGSLSLWMGARYRHSRIIAVSNSAAQMEFINHQAKQQGLSNVRAIAADMNEFDPESEFGCKCRFDRVVSVEMFEHMRNYELLLERIASWLHPQGKLFVHLFCHRRYAYAFETQGASNWMGRYFFTGGLMPSADLIRRFDRHLAVTDEWCWNGTHYQRTAEAWLANLDRRRGRLLPLLSGVYGEGQSHRWLQRWRLFFLAVAELFGSNRGREWFVQHSLLERFH